MSDLTDDAAELLSALDELERALLDNADRAELMRARVEELRGALRAGQPLRELVLTAEQPVIVRLVSESTRVLDDTGSRVRRLEAQVLHREGLTMEQIAALFGVSRQRVSALLRP